jgi:hypothetical protein
MTHLDLLLQRGPQHGDVEGGLDEIRRTVLLDGVPANSDGTVSRSWKNQPVSFLLSH